VKEAYKDEGLLEGVHKGGDGATALLAWNGIWSVNTPRVDFIITDCIGRLLENVTQDTSGVVTAETEFTLTATGVTWDTDDEWILYAEDTKNAVISSTVICRRSGFAYPRWELGPGGIHPDHEDKKPEEVRGRRARGSKQMRRTKLRR